MENFPTIGNSLKLALFLDYDGTLSPICPHPELAVIPEKTKTLLEKLSKCNNIYTAIISGRQADNAKKMVGINSIVYAGSHGFEIIYPDGTRYNFQTPPQEKEKIQNIVKGLNNEVVKNGAWVESKGDVLTYHYRETPEEMRSEMIKKAEEIIRSFGLEPTQAIYGLEVQPKIDWNKGHAAKLLLENKFGLEWDKHTKMLYMGDDTTDERLMEMFVGKASTFRISTSENVKTAAGMRLSSIEDVFHVLKWVENQFCAN